MREVFKRISQKSGNKLAMMMPITENAHGATKLFGRILFTQKNWQDFDEWRLERSKKLDVKTRPILSQVC